MLNSMETSHFSYSHPLSYFTQFSLHENLDCDLDLTYYSNIRISQELDTVQENNHHNYNNYTYQNNSEQSTSYHSYNLQSVLSPPTQSTLPTQKFSANSMPFLYQNNEPNSYIGTVNDAAGSCITNEAVNAPITVPRTKDDRTLTILGGPDNGKVVVAQECPWAEDENIFNPPTEDLLGDMRVGEPTQQLWNEYAETNPSFSTHLNYDSSNYVNTDDSINIYRVDESEQPCVKFEIGGGVDVQEFILEKEICNSYSFDLVADDKENFQQLSTDEQNKLVNENELKNHKDNNTYPLTESNQKHAVKPTYECDQCKKTFTAKCYLTQHNNSKHSEVNLFKCDTCGKGFDNAAARNEHVIKHTGDKPKKCSMCSKSFNHKVDLQRHIVLHTGTKPHTCKICGKGFIRNDHMLKHVETHRKRTARNCP